MLEAPASESHLNIVLVEDHDSLREAIGVVLRQHGHQVWLLSCAEEVDDIPKAMPIDIFVIDLNLPGEDGLSLTRRLRKTHPLVGIVLLTARGEVQDKVLGYSDGADVYLTKPVQEQELQAVLLSLARRKQSQEQVIEALRNNTLLLRQSDLTLYGAHQHKVRLSADEATLLAALARAPAQRLETWQITELLGLDVNDYRKASLVVRMNRLRKKLMQAGASEGCLQALRREGYQLCVAVSVA